MNVDRIEYRTLGSGPYIGAFAFHIYFDSAKTKKDLSPAELISKIITFDEKHAFKDRSIFLSNPFDLPSDQQKELCAALKSLKEKGFFIIAKFIGQYDYEYLNYVHYRIAIVDSNIWLELNCNEIWFPYGPLSSMTDPMIGKNHLQGGTILYLLPSKETLAEDTIKFLQFSKYAWRLLRYQKPFVIPVYNHKDKTEED